MRSEAIARREEGEAAEWALDLFRHSVLKQEKYRRIVALLGGSDGKTCLDVGGDNGVISYLLRRRGGTWYSGDLDAPSVEAVRALVGERVHRLDGGRTPFPDDTFDVIVIVDYLEHIENDREFATELRRILRPGGTLIVNVPHLRARSLVMALRHLVGLTDERHGHVRPGYDLEGLRRVLPDGLVIEESRTYSKAFSEFIDIALNAGYAVLSKIRGNDTSSRKGTIVTREGWQGGGLAGTVLRLAYPALWAVARLDALLFWRPGYKLIVRARLRGPESA